MVTNISHSFFQVDSRSKGTLLKSLLDEEPMGTAIVFTRTKHKAKKLALQLTKGGYKATSLQGNLSQSNRQRALDGFKDGTYTLLIATDIASRGIDVAGISHVINFDMPETAEAYTHRTGRTGRAGLSGAAFTFVTAEDSRMIKSLQRSLGDKLNFKSHNQPSQDVVTDHKGEEMKKSMPKLKRPPQRAKGKRSSQRNRSIAFDFGV
jgi:superfamily II DNA/RNA helicase